MPADPDQQAVETQPPGGLRHGATFPRSSTEAPIVTRLRLTVRGAVQGVGFRPFVYRLATELQLTGWVNNSAQGVTIEVEGERVPVERFLVRLAAEKPPRSFIQSLESSWLDPAGHQGFVIRPSTPGGEKCALVLPDLATCPDCQREIFDPGNRRHRYPFTNCTNCGPRYSIIESLPYDRPNTSMRRFAMCPVCQAEYENPLDRRFHAQPNACPQCGPHLELWDREGRVLAQRDDALLAAAAAIRAGRLVALKGLGGFQLLADARSTEALQQLRQRKRREEKPFAIMVPSLAQAKTLCTVDALEERLLLSPEAPIVLLRQRPSPSEFVPRPPSLGLADSSDRPLSPLVAPGNPYLGLMLPYTPLHHLLLAELGLPLVATSGNLSDEPICIEEREALDRLGAIADLFLVHNRPIVRHVDDSMARVLLGREQVLRRARGYAPLPITVAAAQPRVLAVGAHLKNSVALAVGHQVFVSQHIGDLETPESLRAFERVTADLQQLYATQPEVIVADAHPDYLSTKFARRSGLPVEAVQHHVAHVLACLAENELTPPALGISWDGTGYGLDGTIWGGEFLLVDEAGVHRVAHLRPFRLPGGEKAVKEPRRVALGLLYELYGARVFDMTHLAPVAAFSGAELAVLKTMLAKGLNSPATSSVGRLFDAVASLIGLHQKLRFEGQAAMALEFALDEAQTEEAFEFSLTTISPAPSVPCPTPLPLSSVEASAIHPSSLVLHPSSPRWIVDWAPAIGQLLADVERGLSPSALSARFHNGLVEAILAVARRVQTEKVVLTGGCFQNRFLTERAVRRLTESGFRAYWHQRVPPNDGGIALGQAVAFSYPQKAESKSCA